MNWYIEVLKKYAVFEGRARRKEYWMFVLVHLIIMLLLMLLEEAIGVAIFSTIYLLAVLIPSLAVGARRLHDTGRTGWWLLLSLIPVIGTIVLIVFFVLDSEDGPNQYGENPKHPTGPTGEPMTAPST